MIGDPYPSRSQYLNRPPTIIDLDENQFSFLIFFFFFNFISIPIISEALHLPRHSLNLQQINLIIPSVDVKIIVCFLLIRFFFPIEAEIEFIFLEV